jgi:hypothetical protein
MTVVEGKSTHRSLAQPKAWLLSWTEVGAKYVGILQSLLVSRWLRAVVRASQAPEGREGARELPFACQRRATAAAKGRRARVKFPDKLCREPSDQSSRAPRDRAGHKRSRQVPWGDGSAT